jgi:hypothetical protein
MKNIFQNIVEEEKLNRKFKSLKSQREFNPAKLLIESIAEEMNDKDKTFIRDFQTTGFDARIWEMFLFKFIQENNFKIIEKHNRPDFEVIKNGINFFIEATSSSDIKLEKFTSEYIAEAIEKNDLNAQDDIIDNYVIRLGSILYSKLNKKKYWELDWVKCKPLVFAITPAHNDFARKLPDAKIIEYLYGLSHILEETENGTIIKTLEKVDEHTYESKRIPPKFFYQERVENISAVIFTNNSDLHKFNRMGYQMGISKEFIIMQRGGLGIDIKEMNFNKEFNYPINPGEIRENWSESVIVFHNPNAKYPLDKSLFENVRQVWLDEKGEIDGTIPSFFAYYSETISLALPFE